MRKPNKDIRILDTGVVCVETTDSKGNHKIETYTIKNYLKLCKKRIEQQEAYIRTTKSLLLFVIIVEQPAFIQILAANIFVSIPPLPINE